jgi:hypothetical protein
MVSCDKATSANWSRGVAFSYSNFVVIIIIFCRSELWGSAEFVECCSRPADAGYSDEILVIVNSLQMHAEPEILQASKQESNEENINGIADESYFT